MNKLKLVFATNNQNKLEEVKSMLTNFEIVSLKEIGCFDDIPETAATLEGNAKLKADYITKNYGMNCFADDTGLEVEALDMAPGVYSARYAGDERNPEANTQKLLSELEDKANRKAQFRTAIALNLNNELFVFEGVCRGEILKTKRGSKGFGYDPIFKPESHHQSFAEMDMEEKGKISHRGLAVQQLVTFLKNYS